MVAPRTPPPEYLRKHVGHEIKYLCYAAAQHSGLLADQSHWLDVAAQDSALVRARALLLFQRPRNRSDHHSVSVCEMYDDPSADMPWSEASGRWFAFISDRIAHLGVSRDGGDENFWPCGNVDERLELLARHVLGTLTSQRRLLSAECRPVMELIIERADEYLAAPSEDGFHAMDPANLVVARNSGGTDEGYEPE